MPLKQAPMAIALALAAPQITAAAPDGDAQIQLAYEETLKARAAGRPDIAETILRGLIERRPNATQLRFDLGVALGEQGRCAAAARAFNRGEDLSRSPSFDRASVTAMEDLCPGLAPWDVNLGFNIVHDSNANGGAGSNRIDIYGLPFILSDDATAQQETGYLLTGSVAYNAQLTHTTYIVPEIAFAVTDYSGGDLDSYLLSPSLHFRYRGDRIDWQIGPTSVLRFDRDGLESTGFGLSGRAGIAISPQTSLDLEASYLSVSDEETSLRDYDQATAGGVIYHMPAGWSTTFRAGVFFTARDYEDDYQDISSATLSVGATGEIAETIGYDLSYAYTESWGHTDHYLFGEREDNIHTVEARASFADLEGWFGRPYVGVSHTISDSSWGTKTYDRTRLLAGFTKRF